MHLPRLLPPPPFPRMARALGFSLGLLTLGAGGCSKGDVGAPCNHGQVDPPETKVVTFPALSCNELICVYGDADEAPATPCMNDDDCNPSGLNDVRKFSCDIERGQCQLSSKYVLERSMCSRKCSSDKDCADDGLKKVRAEKTECKTGFACQRIQGLGQFCCEKLCVCKDDLTVDTELDMGCANSTQKGCCVDNPSGMAAEACGKP